MKKRIGKALPDTLNSIINHLDRWHTQRYEKSSMLGKKNQSFSFSDRHRKSAPPQQLQYALLS
jgi:hypothetical protein